jgi:oligosaccharide repeat unit polymerase
MTNYEFFLDILNHINLFLSILVFSCLLHFFLFRKLVKSFLDPYFISVFYSVFCFSDVLFMFLINKISFYVFSSYILTQLGFILGFYTYSKIKDSSYEIVNEVKESNRTANNLIAFYFFSIIYLFFQGIIYATKGIPIFMVSRLETFTSGGGAGILGRVTEVSSIFALYAFFLVTKIDKFRLSEFIKYGMIGLIFLTFMLSGSKSSFLTFFYVFWCYMIFAKIKGGNYQIYLDVLRKNIKSIIGASIVLVCLVIYVQSKNFVDEGDSIFAKNPLVDIALRFVYSGDIFWYSYPNSVYLTIPSDRSFAALFTDVLGLFRIYDWEDLPEVIGLTMKRYHHPSDVITGSNARHNVFGLIYFGFLGSILFSYVIGFLLSFIRNKLPYYLSNTFFGGGVFAYIMMKSAGIDTDPVLTLTSFDNLFFIFPILFLGYLVVIEFMKIKRNENNI